MKKLYLAAALAASVLTAGCANSALMVEKPLTTSYSADAISIEYTDSTVEVDQNNIDYTQKKMEEAFYQAKDVTWTQGNEMTIRYRFIGFNEGSRAGRYLTGGLAGGSKIVIEADFISSNGEVLSTIRAEGSVSGGLAGGSNKTGIDKAVEKIAYYASSKFNNQ